MKNLNEFKKIVREVLLEELGPTALNKEIVELAKTWKKSSKKKVGNSYYLLVSDLTWKQFENHIDDLKRMKVPSVFSVIILVGPSGKARVQYFKSQSNANYAFENNI
jgi:hypothetical protein